MVESDPRRIRPFGQAAGRPQADSDEDPLVELARIVSEDSGFYGARPAEKPRAPRDAGADRNAFSADLEAELLQELESSFAPRGNNSRSAPTARFAPQTVRQDAPPQPPAEDEASLPVSIESFDPDAVEAEEQPAAPPGEAFEDDDLAPEPATEMLAFDAEPELFEEPETVQEPEPDFPPQPESQFAPPPPREDADELLRSIEEQLGQFERRAQAARPRRFDRSRSGGPPRTSEPPPLLNESDFERRLSDDLGPSDDSILRPIARNAPPAEDDRRPDASVPPRARQSDAPGRPQGVGRPSAGNRPGEQRGVAAANADRPAPGGQQRTLREFDEAQPLRRRDNPFPTDDPSDDFHADAGDPGASPAGRWQPDPPRPRPQGRTPASPGWNEQPGAMQAAGGILASGVDWDQRQMPGETNYRDELRTTFGDLDEVRGPARPRPIDDPPGLAAGFTGELEPSYSDPSFGTDWGAGPSETVKDEPRVAAAAPLQGHARSMSRKPPRRNFSRAAAAAVGLVAILAAAAGAYTYFGSGEEELSGPAPVISADTGDVKVEAPAQQADGGGDTAGDAVYNRVAGTAPPADEQVADAPEEPKEISRIVLPPPQSDSGQTLVRPVGQSGGAAGGDTTVESEAAAPDETPIGARRVRTFVVKPDGTISADAVPRPDPAPQQVAAATPVEPVEVQTTPINETNASVASAPPAAASADPVEMPASAVSEPAPELAPSLPDDAPAAEAEPAPAQAAVEAAPSVVASAPAASVPAASARSGGYAVQVSSQRSRGDAQSSLAGIQRRYGSVLGDLEADIQEADLGAKGVYYRARLGGWATRAEAVGVCEQLKAAGGTCFVVAR